MPRLYVDAAAPLTPDSDVVLPDAPAHHLTRVLRMGEGAPVVLFDGRGREAGGLLVAAGRKEVVVRLASVWDGQPASPLAVHLGQAISKGDRMDYAIQKAVELGVAAITPLYTEHGDVRLKGEREAKKLGHWQAVAISACEQCGRAIVPTVYTPRPLADWLDAREESLRLILHPATQNALQMTYSSADAALLIGPEGGISDREVALAATAGFQPLTLGPRILRTETAPVVALSLLQHYFGDL
ncbi:16S rRNA (uracil(1498)-N(3))-methyltransferase [Halomonas sp. Bachu 37]|uniref:16S rRNA (uracil(1498)-N(3))-methyltransferase n=1 Tax=Halomonas kashgarensis TaxID=3084920 RepID=UPI00321781E7